MDVFLLEEGGFRSFLVVVFPFWDEEEDDFRFLGSGFEYEGSIRSFIARGIDDFVESTDVLRFLLVLGAVDSPVTG